jgi:DNA-binding PadR family transcriptional regulator
LLQRGQIYPTLAALEQKGQVRRLDSVRTGASTFAITPTGMTRLKELLAEPIQHVPPRNGLLLRLFFGRHLGPAACRSLVRQAQAEAESRLRHYEDLYQNVMTEDDPAGDRPYWLLTIAAGQHSARAALTWANDTLAVLDDLDQSSNAASKGKGKAR